MTDDQSGLPRASCKGPRRPKGGALMPIEYEARPGARCCHLRRRWHAAHPGALQVRLAGPAAAF